MRWTSGRPVGVDRSMLSRKLMTERNRPARAVVTA